MKPGAAPGPGGPSRPQRQHEYWQAEAASGTSGECLYGFSDGALTADGRVGAYGWLLAVADGEGGLKVLVCGGGAAVA